MSTQTRSAIRPWFVWGSAGLFAMYQFLLQGAPSVMIPDLVAAFGINTTQVGLLTTYFFYSYIIMQIPSGVLVDLFGPKVIIIIGCLAAATGCILFSNCHALWVANGSRLFMGLTCAPAFVATLTIASRWFDSKKFALVIGFTETLAMVGAAIGAILLAQMACNWGWRKAMFITGFVGYFISILIFFIVRNYPSSHKQQPFSLSRIDFTEHARNLWSVMKTLQVWIAGCYAGLTFALVPAFFSLWGIPFFMHQYQLDSPKAATITACGYVGAGIGGPILGWISDRISRRRIVMIVSSFCASLIMAIIIFIPISKNYAFLLSFFLGFSISSYVLPYAVVGEIIPDKARGKAMGFINCITLLFGAPLLQPLIGSLLKNPRRPILENFRPALILLFITLFLAFILSFCIKETYCLNKVSKKS